MWFSSLSLSGLVISFTLGDRRTLESLDWYPERYVGPTANVEEYTWCHGLPKKLVPVLRSLVAVGVTVDVVVLGDVTGGGNVGLENLEDAEAWSEWIERTGVES
jgi:hypothetical protein